MKNLRNIRYDVCTAAADATAACWDASKDEIVVAFGPTEDEPRVRLARVVDELGLQCLDITSWDALSPNPDLAVDRIVRLHYFGDMATACVVMAGGDIVMVREDEFGAGVHIEIVGSVDPGIADARWSPDEEVLALVTTSGNFMLMSRGFETIGETLMTPADLAASKHVSVGWGKKETQFHGRGAAKAMRDPTIPQYVDEGALSPADDGAAVSISWRGDGQFVAVNAVEQTSTSAEEDPKKRRVVRVYNREAVLDSASEPVDGLQSSLSWRPSGNLLATVQRKSESQFNVIFFERNGLRHGQFELRIPIRDGGVADSDPVSLEWSSDSAVLAVTYKNAVQLWTMGNYHWYLKQEISMLPQRPLTAWHPEKALRLLAAGSDGIISAEYVFAIARGPLTPPYDHGSVAVVDGRSIKFTPLRITNIPPPMSTFELLTSSPVVDIAFTPDDSILAALHTTGLDIFKWCWPTTGKRPPQPKLIAVSFSESGFLAGIIPLQIRFLNQGNTISILGYNADMLLASFDLPVDSGPVDADISPASSGSILVESSQARDLYIHDSSGSLSKSDLPSASYDSFSVKLPNLLPWAEVVELDDVGTRVAIGLSRNGHLYANERLLAKSCTSFLVTADHLVLTTGNHLLKFVHLANSQDLEVPLDDPEVDERCRSIERGARLVTSIPSNMSVVLQMPRGNLETIFPRAMVVAGIRKLIDALDYGKAFSFCRTQRVDMNILYDHKPDQFLANVGRFLDQLKDVGYIDLFLSSLREEDVSQTMYKDTKTTAPPAVNGNRPPPAPFAQTTSTSLAQPQSKVNTVCDAVLKGLAPRKKTNLQNIITAYVCKAPPALDDGLRLVAQLFQEDTSVAEKAVEHICFLVDVNQLYDHALGLYNLELTLLVAQQSQRDPREYVPFIQSLHEMSELQRQYTIDDHLERHEKALGHLQALDEFDKFVAYTSKHKLHNAALGMYRYDHAKLRVLTELHASYLASMSKYREAGVIYESLGMFPEALNCYESAGVSCWRECLFVAKSQDPPLSDEAMVDVASRLAEALYEAKDYTSSATVQLEHLSSIEAAIRCLCKAYEFAEAMRVAVYRGRADLLQKGVDPGLGDALSSSTELLADCRSQLKAQVPRILELRQKAAEDPLGFYEGERLGGDDIPDDVSVAASSRLSTGASLFTRYSTGTAATGKTGETGGSRASQQSRNRKKREEKKRARGRKGTVYELEYLVNSVRRLVERVERARPEITRLIIGLNRRSMSERARAIEALMVELVESCQAAIAEVWQPGAPLQALSSLAEAFDGSQQNGSGPVSQIAPVIATFEKLSLLG